MSYARGHPEKNLLIEELNDFNYDDSKSNGEILHKNDGATLII